MTDVSETLAERGSRYGEFPERARITQNIKRAMQDSANWKGLTDDKKEALEMVAHKVGRILNGDPEYADSWHDIIGYTKLVEDELGAQMAEADDGPIVVSVREQPPQRLDQRSTLYIEFDKDFLPDALIAGTEYRVSLVSEISIVVTAEKKTLSIYFENKALSFSKEVREMLDSHLRYYR